MSRRLRVQVTVSQPMIVALEVLAARNGLTVAAQTALTLRQALERTMGTAEVKRRVAVHVAQRTHAQWIEETVTDHAIETAYTALGGGVTSATDRGDCEYPAGAPHAVAGEGVAR